MSTLLAYIMFIYMHMSLVCIHYVLDVYNSYIVA